MRRETEGFLSSPSRTINRPPTLVKNSRNHTRRRHAHAPRLRKRRNYCWNPSRELTMWKRLVRGSTPTQRCPLELNMTVPSSLSSQKQKPRISPELCFCFCSCASASCSMQWPSTCRPCHRRGCGRRPKLPSSPESQRSSPRSSASGRRLKPRSAAPSASPLSGR